MLAPEVGTEVMLGTVVGSLRERAGRLGSYVVMMLSAVSQEDLRLLSRLQRGTGELGQLHDVVAHYAAAALPGEKVHRALQDVETFYFRTALPFAERTAANEALDNSMSAAVFTREYVPGIRYVEALRQQILKASTEKLDSLKAAALARLVSAAVLIAVICAILIVLAVMFKRSLFNPLLIARGHVLAIAEGDLAEPVLKGGMSPEVRDMFKGLSVLREQQRQKRDLEREQARLLEQLKMLAERDYLTGLLNRRAIESDALRLIAKTEREGKTLTLLLVDIDHFKAINDTYGHDVGDVVLQKIARIFDSGIRPGDVVSRFGGEEFLILLDGAGEVDAMAIAERLRRNIEKIVIDQHPDMNITASFGVALHPAGCGLSWNNLVQTADRRLYAAKRTGRNRIVMLDEDEMVHEVVS